MKGNIQNRIDTVSKLRASDRLYLSVYLLNIRANLGDVELASIISQSTEREGAAMHDAKWSVIMVGK